MSEKKGSFKKFFAARFVLDGSNRVTIEHIKLLCSILDEQDEEFEEVKKGVAELEKKIAKMKKGSGVPIRTQTFGGGS